MNVIKLFILLFLAQTLLEANIYYAKVEPYTVQKISSNVTGVVMQVREDMLGKKLSQKPFIVIDAQLDKEELKHLKKKLLLTQNMLYVDENITFNLAKSLEKKRLNYEKVKNLKIKSSVEKDREFYDLINSENGYLLKQNEINTLKMKLSDLELRESQLLRILSDKSLVASGLMLYSLNVKVGEVVNKSTPLATLIDTNKAILTIYLDEEDMLHRKDIEIYIDGKQTGYKIDRLLTVADAQNISKYMAQIIIKSPKIFSKLVKIELKSKNAK